MRFFYLMGRPTLIFRTVRAYRSLLGADCVVGVTLDGKRQAVARAADVVPWAPELTDTHLHEGKGL